MDIARKLAPHHLSQDRVQRLHALLPTFAQRADTFDREGRFVQENYDDLKTAQLFSAGIPLELGGGGLDYVTVANLVVQMAQACGSTALAYVMHSHPVLLNVYKFKNAQDAKAKAALSKIATSELIIAGTGANDWLQSNGRAEPVDGGYRVTAHKHFVSGCPGAQVLVTSAVTASAGGDVVLHLSIPFASAGVRILNNWDTLGMRGTGSHDVVLSDVFVPEDAIVARRPAGQWHGVWDLILPVAMPLIVSCYLGLAEQAATLALDACKGKEESVRDMGALQNQLLLARLSRNAMVEQCQDLHFKPGMANTESILACKTLATNAIQNVVTLAANLVGGSGFFKHHTLERIQCDVRAAHFHPLPEVRQLQMSGRLALGLSPLSASG